MGITLEWPDKDPDEVLDYDLDWSTRGLSADNPVATYTPTVVAGNVTIATGAKEPSHSGTWTKVWLTGGTLGETCEILNRVTAQDGQVLEHTRRIRIRAK